MVIKALMTITDEAKVSYRKGEVAGSFVKGGLELSAHEKGSISRKVYSFIYIWSF